MRAEKLQYWKNKGVPTCAMIDKTSMARVYGIPRDNIGCSIIIKDIARYLGR